MLYILIPLQVLVYELSQEKECFFIAYCVYVVLLLYWDKVRSLLYG